MQLLAHAQSDPILSPKLRLDIENILVRFRIWAGNVGIFAPDNASVDYRLRHEADIADVLVSMLTSLKGNLEQAIKPQTLWEELEEDDKNTTSWESASSSSSSSLSLDLDETIHDLHKEPQNNVDNSDPVRKANSVIDHLYQLASVLRKPVSSTENSKVRDFISKQKSRGDIEELEDVEDHARCYMQARFEKAPKALVDRLVSAVVFRRMKLRYRQRHQEKLNQGPVQAFLQNPEPTILSGEMVAPFVHTSPRAPAQSSVGQRQRPGGPPRSVLPATNASSVNRSKFANYAKSTLSGITQTAVIRRQQLDVPPPPSIMDATHFICPYCLRIIDKEEMQEPRWTHSFSICDII